MSIPWESLFQHPAKRATTAVSLVPPPDGLTPAQRVFALTHLKNGFNATRAYQTAHPAAALTTCAAQGWLTIRNHEIRAWLNVRLEHAWTAYQMASCERTGCVPFTDLQDHRLMKTLIASSSGQRFVSMFASVIDVQPILHSK